jgi:hypothetical protein
MCIYFIIIDILSIYSNNKISIDSNSDIVYQSSKKLTLVTNLYCDV